MADRPRPQDNILTSMDARLVRDYPDQIDPDSQGVSSSGPMPQWMQPQCCVICGGVVQAQGTATREFWLKPPLRGGEYGRSYVCASCAIAHR